MGKFDGILFCTDFDGTFRVTDENCEAVRYFQANGGRFTVISGRTPEFLAEHLTDVLPNAPLVGCNGALIRDHQSGALLYEGGRNDFAALELVEPFWKQEQCFTAILPFDKSGNGYRLARVAAQKDFLTMEELKRHVTLPIYKVVCIMAQSEDAVLWRDRLQVLAGDRFELSRSWPVGLEISCTDANKGAAAKRLKEMLHARVLVTAGDYENDISMLRAADIGYAVGNAAPSVKAAADRVTVDFREHAIAAIINELDQQFS